MADAAPAQPTMTNQQMSDQLYAAMVEKYPMLGKIMEYFQGYGSYLKDDGKQGTVPENPTPSASADTSAALAQAQVTMDATKAAAAAQNAGPSIA